MLVPTNKKETKPKLVTVTTLLPSTSEKPSQISENVDQSVKNDESIITQNLIKYRALSNIKPNDSHDYLTTNKEKKQLLDKYYENSHKDIEFNLEPSLSFKVSEFENDDDIQVQILESQTTSLNNEKSNEISNDYNPYLEIDSIETIDDLVHILKYDPTKVFKRFDNKGKEKPYTQKDNEILVEKLKGATLEKVSHKFNVTRERIRQILQVITSTTKTSRVELNFDINIINPNKVLYRNNEEVLLFTKVTIEILNLLKELKIEIPNMETPLSYTPEMIEKLSKEINKNDFIDIYEKEITQLFTETEMWKLLPCDKMFNLMIKRHRGTFNEQWLYDMSNLTGKTKRTIVAKFERDSLRWESNIIKKNAKLYKYFEKTPELKELLYKISDFFETLQHGVYNINIILEHFKNQLSEFNITNSYELDNLMEMIWIEKGKEFYSAPRYPLVQNKNYGKISNNPKENYQDNFILELIEKHQYKTMNELVNTLVTSYGHIFDTITGTPNYYEYKSLIED